MIPKLEYGQLADNLMEPPFSYPEVLTPENKQTAIAEQAEAVKILHKAVSIDLKTEDRYFENDGHQIPIRIYYPDGSGPFPIMLHYHGGGWCLCSIDTHDYQCRYYAKNGNVVVVSVEYRLAPEFKFPIGLDDCYEALLWAYKNADSFNGNASKICVCGDSAGGNLAAVVAIMARDISGPQIESQLLVYPATDLTSHETKALRLYSNTLTLDLQFYNKCLEMYVHQKDELTNPRVSPYFEKDLSNLPPVLMILAECDLLADDCILYAQRLEDAGVQVRVKIFEGMPHGFFDYPYPTTFEAMDDINNEIAARFK